MFHLSMVARMRSPGPGFSATRAQLVTAKMIGEQVACDPDLEHHLAHLRQFADAGALRPAR